MISIGPISFLLCPERKNILSREINISEQGVSVFIGGNGSGKTTLLRIIAGIEKRWSGNLEFTRSVKTAFIPTDPGKMLLPWYSGGENLAFFGTSGRSKNTSNIREQQIRQFSKILNIGNSTTLKILSQPVYTLSAGETAMLALVCALSSNPTLLLLDETFSSTSLQTTQNAISELRTIHRSMKIGILLATHRLDIVPQFDGKTFNIEEQDD